MYIPITSRVLAPSQVQDFFQRYHIAEFHNLLRSFVETRPELRTQNK